MTHRQKVHTGAVPYDDVLAGRVRTALTNEAGIRERRMMGGLVFLKDGSMVGGVSGQQLFVRVDPGRREELLRQPDVGPLTIGAKPTKSFVAVNPEAVGSDAELRRWLDLGLQSVS